jgi:hypothetical protein
MSIKKVPDLLLTLMDSYWTKLSKVDASMAKTNIIILGMGVLLSLCGWADSRGISSAKGQFASSFKGRKADYIRYVLEGGCYVIDDEPEYEWCGLVNNALLILAQGPNTLAWSDQDEGTVKLLKVPVPLTMPKDK